MIAWSNELFEVGLPQYMSVEFVKYATLGPDAYAVQRAEELTNILNEYPETDTSCWISDPNTFMAVMTTCSTGTMINPRDFRNMGYLVYMPKSGVEGIIYAFDEYKKVSTIAKVYG